MKAVHRQQKPHGRNHAALQVARQVKGSRFTNMTSDDAHVHQMPPTSFNTTGQSLHVVTTSQAQAAYLGSSIGIIAPDCSTLPLIPAYSPRTGCRPDIPIWLPILLLRTPPGKLGSLLNHWAEKPPPPRPTRGDATAPSGCRKPQRRLPPCVALAPPRSLPPLGVGDVVRLRDRPAVAWATVPLPRFSRASLWTLASPDPYIVEAHLHHLMCKDLQSQCRGWEVNTE